MRYATFTSIVVALVAPTSVAWADTDEEVSKKFSEAMTAYNAGEWAKAATAFMDAYQLEPEAVFLYNASKARGAMAGDDPTKLRATLALLERARFQKESPLEGELVGKAQEYEIELRARLKEAERLEEERKRTDLEAKNEKPLIAEPADPGGLTWLGWSGLGVAVLGVAGFGVTGIQGVGLASDVERLGEIQDRAEYDSERSRIESAQGQGRVQLYVSGALVGVGLVALAIDLAQGSGIEKKQKEGSAGLRLGVGPTGIVVRGTF